MKQSIGSSLIGLEVVGVRSVNEKDGVVDGYTIMFSDGSELSFSNEYLEGFGWTKIGIKHEAGRS